MKVVSVTPPVIAKYNIEDLTADQLEVLAAVFGNIYGTFADDFVYRLYIGIVDKLTNGRGAFHYELKYNLVDSAGDRIRSLTLTRA